MKNFGKAMVLGVLAMVGACGKVPIVDINASFSLADATWFENEQTLFLFYTVSAEQGLSDNSLIEVTWRTDEQELPWTPVVSLTPIHTHLPVICGPNTLCGSMSLHVEKVPRQVGLRLRYHRDGEPNLVAPTVFNIVGAGPAYSQRSLVVYGVFDEKNDVVQWRSRNQFPTLRNQQVTDLGLRRWMKVEGPQYGDVAAPIGFNPYGYAATELCPPGLTPLPWAPLETENRAITSEGKMPLAASAVLGVCAATFVKDAKGIFQAAAMARKNPEVRPAFPSLRSPVKDNVKVGFVLKPCNRELSPVHLSMQVQRMLLEGFPEICIDDFKDPNFVAVLATRIRLAVEAARTQGKDMVVTLAVHHDDTKRELGAQIEKALEAVLPGERDRTSPHVSGAFVFDSFKYSIQSQTMRSLVLWCPSSLDLADLDKIPDTSTRDCPLVPDFPDIILGPFKFSNLPILPSRLQYLTFIEKYSVASAGRVIDLNFVAPERTPISQNVLVGDFGVATFFNNESFSAEPSHAFSYCQGIDDPAVVFRSPIFPMPLLLSSLPEFHDLAPSDLYQVGLFWQFPYLTKMKYEFVVAGALKVASFKVPFGPSVVDRKLFGGTQWDDQPLPDGGIATDGGTAGQFDLSTRLIQCTRFCDHPTFHQGTYNVLQPFRGSFRAQCFVPIYPPNPPAGGGFPLDP